MLIIIFFLINIILKYSLKTNKSNFQLFLQNLNIRIKHLKNKIANSQYTLYHPISLSLQSAFKCLQFKYIYKNEH